MQDTSISELTEMLRKESEATGSYKVKVRVLRWLQQNREKLGEELKESLLKEIA